MTRLTSAVLDIVPPGSGWQVAGTGDFDGDGVADILWRNSISGDTHIWKINGATMTRLTSAVLDIVPPGSGWQVAGTGDFDGDGDADVLWRNSISGDTHIWKINGATMTRLTSAVLDIVPPGSGWQVAGTGDFDGDGVDDILWRNTITGDTHIWEIDPATMTRKTSAILDVVPPNSGWQVAGTGDFDGDGDTDILWRNTINGATHIWKIDSATMTRQSSAVLDVVPPNSGWQVQPSFIAPSLPTPTPPVPPAPALPPVMSLAEFDQWRGRAEYTSRNPFPSKGMNCTWYAHGRMKQLGYRWDVMDRVGLIRPGQNNAGQWNDPGNYPPEATISNTPQAACIAVWEAGVGGSGSVGHVAVVERVNADGSILISESNWAGQRYSTRTIRPGTRSWPSNFIIVPRA
jgi:surface antigen